MASEPAEKTQLSEIGSCGTLAKALRQSSLHDFCQPIFFSALADTSDPPIVAISAKYYAGLALHIYKTASVCYSF